MNVVEITKKLISIPSFVDSTNNESKIAEWIFKYLKNNSGLLTERQFVGPKRFNIIVNRCARPDILICGHMDTVQPNQNWTTDPFNPKQKEGKIFGLGSSDMKAGIAVMLALACQKTSQKVMYLFYCDEEYDFQGMKKFIKDFRNQIKPKLIISADGEALKIGNSCRGLIELTVKATGKSGHAANPKSGINAIISSQIVIDSLGRWLKSFSIPELGKSTLNIAYIYGGADTGRDKLAREGNIIPNYCEYVVEIRAASQKLNADLVANFIAKESEKRGLKLKEIKIRHDLDSWITPTSQLKQILKLFPAVKIADAKKRGYVDIQMLWEAFGKVPCLTLGAGTNAGHKENEYMTITNLRKAEKFYTDLIVKTAGR